MFAIWLIGEWFYAWQWNKALQNERVLEYFGTQDSFLAGTSESCMLH